MTILVLGNGFDLAHDLPTKYSHFLQFVQLFRDYELYLTGEKRIPSNNQFLANCHEIIKEIYNSSCDSLYREMLLYTSDNNLLLNHFLNTYQSRCEFGKDGWVDFEAEIADIVHLFDEARRISIQMKSEGKKCVLSNNIADRLTPFILYNHTGCINSTELRGKDLFPEFIEEQAQRINNELNSITRLLEIYLLKIASKQRTSSKLKVISDLHIDKILSFNYTETFQKLYDPDKKAEYCYIHGKINETSSLTTCGLVLGINEFLDNNLQNQDNAFVWFKKFYQRIIKETSSAYIDWLDDNTLLNARLAKIPPTPLDIYFYGHSLDSSDRDVLRRLILHKNARIYFFYPNKKEMAKQINNLIRVIDADNLIQMTRGKKRSIQFIPVS